MWGICLTVGANGIAFVGMKLGLGGESESICGCSRGKEVACRVFVER